MSLMESDAMRFFVCAGSFFYRAVLVFVLLLWLDVNICDGCIFSNIYFSVNRILYKRPVMLSEKGCQKSKRDVVASASDKVVLGGRVYLLKLFNGRQEDLVQCLQYCARIGEKMPICYFANMYSCVENVDTSTHGFSIWLKSLISTSASDDDYFHWWIHETSGYQEATIPLKRFLSSSECISLTRWNFFDKTFACLFHLIKGLGVYCFLPIILYLLLHPFIIRGVCVFFHRQTGSATCIFKNVAIERIIIPLALLCFLVTIHITNNYGLFVSLCRL